MGDILLVIAVLAFFVFLSRLGSGKRQEREQFGALWPGVEGEPDFCLSLYNERKARALCRQLEAVTQGYINHPLRLDITEVGKFCETLIHMKALFGDGRNETIRNLMSYFSNVQKFFRECGYSFFTERSQRKWLLKECESLFASYHAEVLDDIRRRLNVGTDYSSDNGVEIYRQVALLYQMCGGDKCCRDFRECSYEFREWRARIFQQLIEEALNIYLKCLRDVLTSTCLPLIRNGSETLNKQPETKHYPEEAKYYPEVEKHKPTPKSTVSNPYLSAPYLLDKLSRGAKIYLSGALVLETVKYSGRNCVEVWGLEGKYRNEVLDCGGKSVEIDGREHILIATDNVLALDYLLVFHKVLNVYDAPVCELEPENATPTTHQKLPSEPPKTTPPTYNPPSAPPDKPAELTTTALALIGRPTLHDNEYITPAMTQSRHEAERPFVKILSATYRTDAERKAMSRHFMLWKEFAVFVALSQVLKSDKTLLAQTQIMLKERLNEGLPSDVLKKRVEIMRVMSGIFTADYKISGSLEQSFLRTFRETLPDGLPELPDSESVGGYLVGIYRFIYGRLKREYQGLRERERV